MSDFNDALIAIVFYQEMEDKISVYLQSPIGRI
jgi:hypothetical protein